MAFSPTARQSQLLRFIESHTAATGTPPSFSQMGAHLFPGAKHPKGQVATMLDRMESRGLITRQRGRGSDCTVRVLHPGAPQVHLTREQGLAFAREWREANLAMFDALYGPEPTR